MTYLTWGCDPLTAECESCLDALCNACCEEYRKKTGDQEGAGVPGPACEDAYEPDCDSCDLEKKPDGKMSILVPVNGTEPSRRAAEVAITMARANKASLTVLYVAVRGAKSGARRGLRTRRHEEAILKDIVAIADAIAAMRASISRRNRCRCSGSSRATVIPNSKSSGVDLICRQVPSMRV